jgi:hypothetical protein
LCDNLSTCPPKSRFSIYWRPMGVKSKLLYIMFSFLGLSNILQVEPQKEIGDHLIKQSP